MRNVLNRPQPVSSPDCFGERAMASLATRRPLCQANGWTALTPLEYRHLVLAEKLAQHRVLGGIHFCDGAEEPHPALVQQDHAIGEHARQAGVVGDDDAGQLDLALDAKNELGNRMRHDRVHHGGGLVVEDGLGMGGQRARNRHRALHAGRKAGREEIALGLQLQQAEQLVHGDLDLFFGAGLALEAALAQREGDVLAHGERIEKRARLEHQRDLPVHGDSPRATSKVTSSSTARMAKPLKTLRNSKKGSEAVGMPAYSISASSWPVATVSPLATARRTSAPDFGARTSFCIFMASSTSTPCPHCTASPACASRRTTFPAMGALRRTRPDCSALRCASAWRGSCTSASSSRPRTPSQMAPPSSRVQAKVLQRPSKRIE